MNKKLFFVGASYTSALMSLDCWSQLSHGMLWISLFVTQFHRESWNDNQSLIPYLLIDWMNSSLLTSPSPFVSAALNASSASLISFWSLTSRKSENSSKERYPSSFFRYFLIKISRRCSKIHKLKLSLLIHILSIPCRLSQKLSAKVAYWEVPPWLLYITVSIILKEVNQ